MSYIIFSNVCRIDRKDFNLSAKYIKEGFFINKKWKLKKIFFVVISVKLFPIIQLSI